MRSIGRIVLGVVTLGVFLAAVASALPAWAAAVRLDFRGAFAWFDEVTHQQTRSANLETREENQRRCVAAKREIAAEVVAQRMDLLEAAARFRDLHAAFPDGSPPVVMHRFDPRSSVQGHRPYEESLCWNVINHVRAQEVCSSGASTTPPGLQNYRSTAVASKLEAELLAQLRTGPVHLRE